MNKNEKTYLFDADLPEEISLSKITLRSEEEYDSDFNAHITALKSIQRINNCFKGNTFLLLVSRSDIVNSIRSKKGILYNYKEYLKFKSNNFEFKNNNKSRLVSIVDLKNFDYSEPLPLMLNSIHSLFVFTELEMEFLEDRIQKWVSKDDKSSFLFDYNSIGKNLDNAAVLRYFPADNGKSETIVVVGDSNYLNYYDVKACF